MGRVVEKTPRRFFLRRQRFSLFHERKAQRDDAGKLGNENRFDLESGGAKQQNMKTPYKA
jgi:hypothetical protein